MIKFGDRVRLIAIPPEVLAVPDERDQLHTKGVFRGCLGRTFRVRGFDEYGHLELWVHGGDDHHRRAYLDSIWVEPEYVDVVTDHDERPR